MTASDGQWRVTRRKWQQPIKNCCHFIVIGCHTYFVGGLPYSRVRAPSEADLGYRPRHKRISVRQGRPCLTDIRRSVGSYCCCGLFTPVAADGWESFVILNCNRMDKRCLSNRIVNSQRSTCPLGCISCQICPCRSKLLCGSSNSGLTLLYNHCGRLRTIIQEINSYRVN